MTHIILFSRQMRVINGSLAVCYTCIIISLLMVNNDLWLITTTTFFIIVGIMLLEKRDKLTEIRTFADMDRPE